MNIFATSYDPIQSARDLPDKLIVKMPIETAQMLSTASSRIIVGLDQEKIYKPSHRNHPCTLWAGACIENYLWLTEHGLEISKEYTRRYNKTHASSLVIQYIKDSILGNLGEDGYALRASRSVTPFALAMPEQYQNPIDPCGSYREYMIKEKTYYAKWTSPGTKPTWWEI